MSNLIVYRKFYWKVENVSRDVLYKYGKNKSICRNVTVRLPENATCWMLEFYPNTESCEFYIFKIGADNDNLMIKSRLYVQTCDGTLQYIDSIEGYSYKLDDNEGFCFSKMFSPQDLLSESNFMKDNCLTFVVELELHELSPDLPSVKPCYLNDGFLSVSDYEKIQACEKLSDFTIVCSDEVEIPVHRLIIALKCPVLMEMLDAETTDHGLNKMKLNDIDSKTMQALLRYLYTGILDKVQSISASMLYAAEKFQLNNLKSICISCLSKNITVQNALDTLIIADHYDDKILEENCIGFIKMKFDQLKVSEDWGILSMRHALKIMTSMEKCPISVQLKSSL